MTIACIGDLHGSERWKEALDLEVDHYVFMGDYVDSYQFDDDQILYNLIDVIDFKIQHPNKVTLLYGNHDYQYRYYPEYRCSGFRLQMAHKLQQVFRQNMDAFEIGVAFDSYVFTHGGLCRKWMTRHLPDTTDPQRIIEKLNQMGETGQERTRLTTIGSARGGLDGQGGPLWCDYYKELLQDPAIDINQVVGHTQNRYLVRNQVGGNDLINVNYLAYSNEPIFVLEI